MPIGRFRKSKFGISNLIFTISVVVLAVVAASGFGLYALASAHSSTTTEAMSHSSTSSGEMASSSTAYEFTPKTGAMLSSAWVIVAPLGMDEYAVSIHAEGLETNGTYIIEGPLSTGSMQVVPVSNESMSMNQTSDSEFQANANGTGQFWIVLSSNPVTTFESFELVYLPGMEMQNATVVATASFQTMTTTTESMS
jgi:hypothetical protein